MSVEDIPRTIEWVRTDGDTNAPSGFPALLVLDQTKLPEEVSYLAITDWRLVIDAIKSLKVRGAPAIGIAGGASVALRAAEFVFARDLHPKDADDFESVFVIDDRSFDAEMYLLGIEHAAQMIKTARPTAVSLSKSVDRVMQSIKDALNRGLDASTCADVAFDTVSEMISTDEAQNREIGRIGADLLGYNSTVLTHCNAGSLATSFYGTALGVVYSAHEQGKIQNVFVDETRPVCQGARLTAFELCRAGVASTLICDDMAASVIASGKVDAVIVGADRIASNGDVVNKIGTLGLAIIANQYNVAFYVAAPTETIDTNVLRGCDIPIEERTSDEVLSYSIPELNVFNPAFDVTPACFITAIITEKGVFSPANILNAL